jgi:phosphotransacetylase
MINLLDSIKKQAQKVGKIIVFPEGDDPRVVKAA